MSFNFLPFFFFFLFSLFLHASSLAIASNSDNGGHSFVDRQVLNLKKLKWKHEQNHTTKCFPQRSRTEKNVTILEVHHKDYCSKTKSNWNQRLRKHILSDQIRVHSLQSRIKTAFFNGFNQELSQAQIPLISGAKLQTLNYIVTVGLGRRHNVTLIVDTGSDVTWVQCEPCGSCYSQQEPLFNPTDSPSYKPVLCKSTTCQDLQSATGNSGVCEANSTTCNYYVSYGDGSYTRGDLASDSIVLGTSLINGFVFGCGRVNDGLFGGASGLMGLGRSALSLVTQTNDVFGGVFSYCLPSVTDKGSGSLILGDEISAYKNSSPISYTKLISNPLLPFYFVNLTGISIGGVWLQDPSFGQKKMLIDSGTVITRLFSSVYNAVKSEFLKQFSGFPKAPNFSILDTCFNLSSYDQVEIPTFKLFFESNAKLTVDVNGLLYFAKSDASQVCLAIAGLSDEEDIGIIGNYQQKNTRVIYNTKASTLGFAQETCSLE